MTEGTTTFNLTVGALIRRQVRRALMTNQGISFVEEKGLIDSLFIVTAPLSVAEQIKAWINRVNGQ